MIYVTPKYILTNKKKTTAFTNHNRYNISFMNTSKSQSLRYNKQFCANCTKTNALS